MVHVVLFHVSVENDVLLVQCWMSLHKPLAGIFEFDLIKSFVFTNVE